MTYEKLMLKLGACKGSGMWRKLAEHSGLNYHTIVKLHRGLLANPGLQTINRLAAAFEALDKPKRRRAG